MLRRLSLVVMRVLLWVSTLAAALVVTLALSERGTAIVAKALNSLVPGLHIEHRSGSLLEPYFPRIGWQGDGTHVEIDGLHWNLAPHCLLSDRLCITRLELARLVITLAASEDDPTPLDLEPLGTPMPVTIAHATVDALEIHRPGSDTLTLTGIGFGGSFTDTRVTLQQFSARMGEIEAALDAQLDLRAQLPLRVDGRLSRAQRQQVELHLAGDLAHLRFQASGSGEYALDAEGFVELLTDAPRIELSASSRETLHPLPDDPAMLAVHDIVLRASGSSEELQLQFSAGMNGTLSGAATLEGSATWTPDETRLEHLELSGDAGRLTATGTLRERLWQAALHADDFCPLAWQPQLECRLSGETTLSGSTDGAAAPISAQIVLGGTINGREAQIEGSATRSGDGSLQLSAVRIHNGANRLQLEGSVAETLAIESQLELGDLGDTLKGAHGSGRASLRIGGTRDDPRVEGTLSAHGLSWQDHAADAVTLRVHWSGKGAGDNRVQLDSSGLVIAGTTVDSLDASFAGALEAHRITLAVRSDTVQADGACTGALGSTGNWRGSCNTLRLADSVAAGEWRLEEALDLAWNKTTGSARIGAFCLRNARSTLCSTVPATVSPEHFTEVVLSGRDIPLSLAQGWLPAELPGDGLLTLDAKASRATGKAPHFEARISGSSLGFGVPVAGDVLAFELSGFTATVQGSSERATLAWQLTVLGGGDLAGNLGIDLRNRQLEGTVSLQALELTRLAGLLPGMLAMKGALDGELHLRGALGAPQLDGSLRLVGGRFVHERLPEPIEDATLAVDFTGSTAHLDGRFHTGSGTATLDGDVLFDDSGWNADIGFHSSGLQIEPLRGSKATVAPRLRLQMSPSHARLSGEVDLPSADIRIDTLPETAVSESPYAVIVGEEDNRTPFSYALALNVRLGDQVRLRGMGVDARLVGALEVTRDATDGLLRGQGEIRVAEGSYKAYGQNLEVSEGRIRFRGALDRPDLRLTAIRHIEEDNVQVGVSVRGSLRDPEISTFSRPAMEETLAMYYLLTGRKPEANGNAELAVSGMLLQLGLAGANRITSRATSRLGIQDFQVAARQVEGGTEVQLSAYLSPDLYLRYGVSTFDRINTARIRYRLRGSFYIEAISGIENAIDFLYSFER